MYMFHKYPLLCDTKHNLINILAYFDKKAAIYLWGTSKNPLR